MLHIECKTTPIFVTSGSNFSLYLDHSFLDHPSYGYLYHPTLSSGGPLWEITGSDTINSNRPNLSCEDSYIALGKIESSDNIRYL
jgi:hypothetical protein